MVLYGKQVRLQKEWLRWCTNENQLDVMRGPVWIIYSLDLVWFWLVLFVK
jgi:hypothetical protein